MAGSDYVNAVLAATGGLPLLMAAVLADPPPLERLPHDVPSVVRHRVRALLAERGPEARRLAEAVAVLGHGAELGRAGALPGMEPADASREADALAADGLLEVAPHLGFEQPLLARAVLDDLPMHALSSLHRRAGQLGAERDDPDVVDGHLLLTQPSGDTWVAQRLATAAGRAEKRNDLASAAAYLSHAVAEPPPLASLPGVLLRLAGTPNRAGRRGCDDGPAARAPATAQRRGQDAGHQLLAQLCMLRGDGPAALALFETALDGADLDDRARLGIRWHKLPPRSPNLNAFVERFHGSVLHVHYRTAFRYRFYEHVHHIDDLQAWLRYYNFERPHRGCRTRGRIPAAIFYATRPDLLTTPKGWDLDDINPAA